ncbi:ORF6N domain-containing protein [Candidatus Woesearchaeota archaeon]|nr:ORF6N domain-containing protein [Candidatus Woesearchaeota archaeon]MBT5271761.1 ORF6N domain-containing protein [Candidatus Woesearchaeota archaeon]MBT6041560.1 ORF6N domain-containing protein [Candidatus Woesearchaeota archaeon]MBT6336319.1 ORF6N domain-containing protein [Candidatus Woesearchaeota archaeon]MBT7927295.1 ORF6N domain-containing protein [Candidatus Woesearchaeota archaeon]
MKNKIIITNIDKIKDKIYTIRGLQVILDKDLAKWYNVETKVLNQAVKRNKFRFPNNFMFQLSTKEFDNLRSQIVTSSWGGRRKPPYVFTEQGVAMLSGVLKSDIAIKISIQIISVFIAMRRFISSNTQIFGRLNLVETKLVEYDKKFEKILDTIQSRSIKPEKGVFFDGQIFDAYKFVSDLIRTAENSIVLIDNYIDDSILTLFSKKNKKVDVTIFTKKISKQLSLDLIKYNAQYPFIEVKMFKQAHDRFLIIDNKKVYHFGASLKDLGKKWFAFSKFDKEALNMLDKLGMRK